MNTLQQFSEGVSMSPPRDATVMFGGPDSLAQSVVDCIRKLDGARELLGDSSDSESAAAVLRRIHKQDLLGFLFINDVAVSDLFPSIQWERDGREFWERTMIDNGSERMVGADGSRGSIELSLMLYVQHEALSAICAPAKPMSPEQRERIDEFRERYRIATTH